MISSKTGSAYKYTRPEDSKICDTYILEIQKGSNSPGANEISSSISSLVKNGGEGGAKSLLMIQEAKEIWEFCFIYFKYQGRQDFWENVKFVKRMDIKQANVSETDPGFRTSGCESVCIQV